MTRRWLAALFAPQAVGQDLIIRPVPRIPKPANGECPVCWTVEEKFAPKLEEYYSVSTCLPPRLPKGIKPGETFTINSVCRSPDKDDLPKVRQVRCAHCSAAFWQDAEPVK